MYGRLSSIDSASGYRNQGPCAKAMQTSGLARSDVFFTTKIPTREHPLNYENTHTLIDKALSETQLSYLDLVLIHSPYGGSANRKAAWRALVESVQAGKVRSIGVSNYGAAHLAELEVHRAELEAEKPGLGGVLSVGQWEVHPWLTRGDVAGWCRERGVVVQAYCAVVRGERFGHEAVKSVAERLGKTEAQILLRWSLQMGFVPLVKSVTPSRMVENAALFDFELDKGDVEAMTTDEYSPCAWDPTIEPLDK